MGLCRVYSFKWKESLFCIFYSLLCSYVSKCIKNKKDTDQNNIYSIIFCFVNYFTIFQNIICLLNNIIYICITYPIEGRVLYRTKGEIRLYELLATCPPKQGANSYPCGTIKSTTMKTRNCC